MRWTDYATLREACANLAMLYTPVVRLVEIKTRPRVYLDARIIAAARSLQVATPLPLVIARRRQDADGDTAAHDEVYAAVLAFIERAESEFDVVAERPSAAAGAGAGAGEVEGVGVGPGSEGATPEGSQEGASAEDDSVLGDDHELGGITADRLLWVLQMARASLGNATVPILRLVANYCDDRGDTSSVLVAGLRHGDRAVAAIVPWSSDEGLEHFDLDTALAHVWQLLERTWHEFEQRKFKYANPKGNVETWFIARVGSATAGFTMRGGKRVHQLWEDDVFADDVETLYPRWWLRSLDNLIIRSLGEASLPSR